MLFIFVPCNFGAICTIVFCSMTEVTLEKIQGNSDDL